LVISQKEMFPSRKTNKLMSRGDRPFKVIQKAGDNAYKLQLPGDMAVSRRDFGLDHSHFATFAQDSEGVLTKFNLPVLEDKVESPPKTKLRANIFAWDDREHPKDSIHEEKTNHDSFFMVI